MDKLTLKRLEKILEKLDEKIEAREFLFDERTEKWQHSEKGQGFQEKTDELQDVSDNLDATIFSLNIFLRQ
jgi:hypothetical protein